MSFTTDGGTAIFPLEFFKSCIKTYTKNHGKAPKLLVVNADDLLDYKLNLSFAQANQLLDLAPELKITHGDYLKKGEIDLAMGIRENKKKKSRKS